MESKNIIIINKPTIDGSIIKCNVNFKGKNIIIVNEYTNISNLYDGLEGFVGLFIPHMIFTGDKLIVRGNLCPIFYQNMLKLREYYTSLNIGDTHFNIFCESYNPKEITAKRKIISTFTGGVDSFHTLLTNMDKIDTVLYCINYDIVEKQEELLKAQLKMVKDVAQKLGKDVITCRTNQRFILERSGEINYLANTKAKQCGDLWGFFLHGCAIFGHAYNLANEYHSFYMPSSVPSTANYLTGSSFHIDHLYSSSFINIVPDGHCKRMDKIKEIIKLNKDIVFEHLRVCYNNTYLRSNYHKDKKYNCSHCEKCVRTYIPIGLININYLKELKTFTVNPGTFNHVKQWYLGLKFTRISYVEFQDDIREWNSNG